MFSYRISASLILCLCILTANAQIEGFIENPTSLSVDRGEQVSLSCAYNTAQSLSNVNIVWTTPPGISVTPTNAVVDANTLRSTITFAAATSSYAGGFQCTATVGSDRFNSNRAALTINYYSIQFEDPLYTVHQASDTFICFVGTNIIGSPSRNALISFTRDDSGPGINDLTISIATPTSVFIEALIPNDNIRLGDRVICLMLMI